MLWLQRHISGGRQLRGACQHLDDRGGVKVCLSVDMHIVE